jgi:G3E family GTPase
MSHSDHDDHEHTSDGEDGHHHSHLDHKHDTQVSSVGITAEGSVDMQKLNRWCARGRAAAPQRRRGMLQRLCGTRRRCGAIESP